MIVKLVCSQANKRIITDILQANNIIISQKSSILIAETGYGNDLDYDVKIIFKEDKIEDFIEVIHEIKGKAKIIDVILGMKNESYRPINIEDICYFNAINNDIFIHLENREIYMTRSKLYQLDEELMNNNFFRINKSELINMNKISLITPMFKGKLIIYLKGYKKPFDISRGYTRAFKERLGF